MSDAEPSRPHADPTQFDALVESLAPAAIVAVIARIMGPHLRAVCEPEDVWQETLAAAWRDRDLHAWTTREAYRAWILQIARNRVRDLARALSAEKRGAGERPAAFDAMAGSSGGSLADVLPKDSVTPSRVATHREQAAAILAALAKLPEDVEPVVRMHLLEEREMVDVAAELGVHLSAAWRRFRRGVRLYRDALRETDSSLPPSISDAGDDA